jgi:hypothetical protein
VCGTVTVPEFLGKPAKLNSDHERRTSTRPQEGQCRSVNAVRYEAQNLAILRPRKSRLAAQWGNYSKAQFLGSGQQRKTRHLLAPRATKALSNF